MRRYFRNLWAALKNEGMALDETEGAILGAPKGYKISMWWAKEARQGKRWACIGCRLLSILVQKDHCEKQLAGKPMTTLSYLRAFACLLVPVILLQVGIHELIRHLF